MFKLTLLSICFCCITGFAQQTKQATITKTGAIIGSVNDQKTNKIISFASLTLYKNDTVKMGQCNSDINGTFSFKNLPFGTYKLITTQAGYQKKIIKSILVNVETSVKISVQLTSTQARLEEIKVVTQDAKAVEGKATKAEYYNHTGYINNTAVSYKKVKEKANYSYLQNGDVEHNTEEYTHIQDNNFKDAIKDPLSTFSIDVDKASYSNIRRFINQNQLPPADAVRVEEMINYFSYNYPQPKNKDPFSITTEYTDCPWNTKHQLVHIGLHGKEIKMDKSMPNNLTFLIDVSGSMNSE